MNLAEDEGLWPLCAADELEIGTPKRVDIDGLPPLAVFRLDDGCYVTADTCTHGNASLSAGFVEGDEIECPWHSGRFCIRDGAPRAAPADKPIKVWPARIVGGQVCIDPFA